MTDQISQNEIQFTVRVLNRETAPGIIRVLVSLSKNVAREYIKGDPVGYMVLVQSIKSEP